MLLEANTVQSIYHLNIFNDKILGFFRKSNMMWISLRDPLDILKNKIQWIS